MAQPLEALAEFHLSEYDAIKLLKDTGHLYCPEALEIGLVTDEDLHLLTLDHPIVKAGLRSYQTWFKPGLDEYSMRPVSFGGHDRPAEADGEVGEATAFVLTQPRCGCPDYYPPNAAMPEEMNWPEACRNEITTSYRMNLRGVTAQELEAAWNEASRTIERAIQVAFTLNLSAYPNTRIFAFAAALGNSVLADQYLARGRCNDALQGRFASNLTWNMQTLVTVILHERLHGIGLRHVQDPAATMFPSIHQASLGRRGAMNESDIAEALSRGYKRRTEQPQPPSPRPRFPAKITVAARIEMEDESQVYREELKPTANVTIEV